jgi:hypothetical protein
VLIAEHKQELVIAGILVIFPDVIGWLKKENNVIILIIKNNLP